MFQNFSLNVILLIYNKFEIFSKKENSYNKINQ